jgi:hypothetical protein
MNIRMIMKLIIEGTFEKKIWIEYSANINQDVIWDNQYKKDRKIKTKAKTMDYLYIRKDKMKNGNQWHLQLIMSFARRDY